MHATPKTVTDRGKVQKWPYDRMGHYRHMKESIPFVVLVEGQYLFDAMVTLRPIRRDGMGGLHVVDWTELENYAVATSDILETWEKKLLMEMCRNYLEGYLEGEEVLSISPMEREDG